VCCIQVREVRRRIPVGCSCIQLELHKGGRVGLEVCRAAKLAVGGSGELAVTRVGIWIGSKGRKHDQTCLGLVLVPVSCSS